MRSHFWRPLYESTDLWECEICHILSQTGSDMDYANTQGCLTVQELNDMLARIITREPHAKPRSF